ncbi:MAG TPA: hypothetical protein VIM55_09590 [Mucilaginibacter sp.]
MKIGRIPVASIVLLVFSLISLMVNLFMPASRSAVVPYLDGGLVGAMLVIGLYYANIYVGAWRNNRRESVTK